MEVSLSLLSLCVLPFYLVIWGCFVLCITLLPRSCPDVSGDWVAYGRS